MNDNTIAGFESLSADINKMKGADKETKQGVVSEKLPELALDKTNEDIIKITEAWKKIWDESTVKAEWDKQWEENAKYWEGKQFDTPKGNKQRPSVDNLIFESIETYLPLVTRRNPEPLVTLDNTEKTDDGSVDPVKIKYVEKVKGRLADLADKNVLRLKLKKGARHWAVYLLGAVKVGWDLDYDMPTAKVIRPPKLILDPDATVDEDGYSGDRIGEIRKLSASRILSVIENETENEDGIKEIKDKLEKDTATQVQFIEWWTPEYMCWTLGKNVLLKKKNPHWNYDKTETPTTDNLASPGVNVDEYGNATANQMDIAGINHFPVPKMPYEFISVFNLGDRPMDKTSLISQNLSNQDRLNKRNRQIDKNADRMNGGMVVSRERSGLTEGQAKNVTDALQKGGTVVIPSGSPREAVDTYSPPALPADVYNDLVDTRARMRDIFGTAGSTPAGLGDEKTVRGKIMNRSLDTDRIGGGVSEYLEQLADNIYNWWLQLLYVYDTGFQFVPGAVPPKLVISVKEGSLLPKDSTSIANQAIELGSAGKMSLMDMYERLEYPNPKELAANVWLEVNAPQLLYADNPMIQQALAMQQQAAAAQAEQAQTDAGIKHERGMEMEQEKGALKMAGEEHRSMLAAVPQNQVG